MVTFTPQTKNTTTLTSILKNVRSFLLKEDAFYLLLETGDKIIIEPDYSAQYSASTKNTVSYTAEAKH